MRLASETLRIAGPGGEIAVHLSGRADGPAVLMAHSILSSSIMWQEQAALLAATGWRVVRADTRVVARPRVCVAKSYVGTSTSSPRRSASRCVASKSRSSADGSSKLCVAASADAGSGL